eukprot:Gb_12926 [translate_table: standard]
MKTYSCKEVSSYFNDFFLLFSPLSVLQKADANALQSWTLLQIQQLIYMFFIGKNGDYVQGQFIQFGHLQNIIFIRNSLSILPSSSTHAIPLHDILSPVYGLFCIGFTLQCWIHYHAFVLFMVIRGGIILQAICKQVRYGEEISITTDHGPICG